MEELANTISIKEAMSIKLDVAKPEEWKMLSQIRLKALKTDPTAFFGNEHPPTPAEEDEKKWRSLLENKKRFFIFAKNDSGIVGCVAALLDDSDIEPSDAVWQLRWAYIDPGLRHCGIGERMYRESLKEIRLRDGRKVIGYILKANENFTAVLALNKKLGFREVEKHAYAKTHYIKVELDLTNPKVLKKLGIH